MTVVQGLAPRGISLAPAVANTAGGRSEPSPGFAGPVARVAFGEGPQRVAIDGDGGEP
jgi:hypothetical protein